MSPSSEGRPLVRVAEGPLARLSPYELRHLGSHLAAAGDAAGLRWLLALELSVELPPPPPPKRRWWQRRHRREKPSPRLRHRNAWYEAKEGINDAGGYREDVESAWRLASQACADAAAVGAPQPLAEELRCALLMASVQSLGEGLPASLLRVLVERGAWSEAHALVYAEQPGEKKVARLIELLPVLSASRREEVVPRLLELSIPESEQAAGARALAEFLDEPQIDRVLAAARGYGHAATSEEVCAALVERLVSLGAVEQALAIAREPLFDEGWKEAEALCCLAGELGEPALRERLAAVRDWATPTTRQLALAGLYPRLAALGHTEEALEGAAEIDAPSQSSKVVTWMAPALGEAARRRAAGFAPGGQDGALRAEAFVALAASATSDGDTASAAAFLDEAVRALESVDSFPGKGEALAAVAPSLATLRPQAAFDLAAAVSDDAERLVALAALVPHCAGAERDRALELASHAAERVSELGEDGMRALSELDPRRASVLAVAQMQEETSSDALVSLAPYVPLEALPELRGRLIEVDDERTRTTTRASLDAELAVDGEAAALERLAVLEPTALRAEVFATIAPRLPEAALPRAAQLLRELEGHDLKGAIPAFASRLDEAGQRALLEEAAHEDYDWAYAAVVEACAPHLSPSLLAHALDLALARRDQTWRAWSFAALAPRLELAQLERGLDRIGRFDEKGRFLREMIESVVAVRLVQLGRVGEGLARAASIEREARWQAEAVCGIAPHLDGGAALAEAERLASKIGEAAPRAEALAALAAGPTGPARKRLGDLALAAAEGELPDGTEAERAVGGAPLGNPVAIAGIVRQLGDGLLQRAVLSCEAAHESKRSDVIAALGPLAGERLAAAVGLAQGVKDPGWRANAFTALAAAASEISPDLATETVGALLGDDFYLHRVENLNAVLPVLLEHGPESVHDAWSAVLPSLTERGRENLSADIGAMAPLLRRVGGADALHETIAAIDDVGRWWP